MHEVEFLAAIEQSPFEDLPKLVYADWLDEQGDPRGQMIRLSVELRRLLLQYPQDTRWLSICQVTDYPVRIDVNSPIQVLFDGWAFNGYVTDVECEFERENFQVDRNGLIDHVPTGRITHVLRAVLKHQEWGVHSIGAAPQKPSS